MANSHIGSSFDDFLKGEGIYEEVTTAAIKEAFAWQCQESQSAQCLSTDGSFTSLSPTSVHPLPRTGSWEDSF